MKRAKSGGNPPRRSRLSLDAPVSAEKAEVEGRLVGQAELASFLGVNRRTIANLVEQGMPKADRARYHLGACVTWYVERQRQKAKLRDTTSDLDRARIRRTLASAHEIELRAAVAEGDLIPVAVHEEVVGRVCDEMQGIIVNIPSDYSLRIEALGVSAEKAEEVLEAIVRELLVALRGKADVLDALADEPDGNASDDLP